MNKIIAEQIVRKQLDKHKLEDWGFKWIKKIKNFRTVGQCDRRNKLIKLQPNFVEKNVDGIIVDTILHEIAHALTKRGHHKFWRKKCLEIGCRGNRFKKSSSIIK